MLFQDVLDAFTTGTDANEKLGLVLRTSYLRLPGEAHRCMFLDAALLLRDRPTAHLTALWEGQLLQTPCASNAGLGFSDLLPPTSAAGLLDAGQEGLRRTQARQVVEGMLESLREHSLISYADGSTAAAGVESVRR